MTAKIAETLACARCGHPRRYTRKTAVLCVDCRYVLSKEEVEQWEPTKERMAA